jgi:predicted ester cyclase
MSAEGNKEFIRSYFGALSGKDKPPELQDQYIADSDQVLKEHIAMFEAAFPHYELIPEEMVAEGEKVAVRTTFRGTHGGDFLGIAPTGKQVDIAIALIYRISGGKIVEHWMLADQMALMTQLGVLSM